MPLKVWLYTKAWSFREYDIPSWDRIHYGPHTVTIEIEPGTTLIVPYANLDHMKICEVEKVEPPPKPKGKCRSCVFDQSDDDCILRYPECPDHLDGEITDGCPKYRKREQE